MGSHDHDDELERLLSGSLQDPEASPELTAFVRDLRTAFPAMTPAAEDAHIAAMVETAHLLADKGDPVARPASNADAPAEQVSWLPKRRRIQVTERKWDKLVKRGLVPLVAAFTVMGGVAWAGGLPDPLQGAAATAAGWVGLEIPGADDEGETTEAPEPDETDVPDATNEDDQGEDTQDATECDTPDATNEDDQGEDTQDATNEDDQGEDTQDATECDSPDATNDDDQGEDTQGDDDQGDTHDATNDDDQGDDTQGDTSGDNEGDSSGSGSGDSQDDGNDQGGDTSGDSEGDSSGDSSGSGSGSGDNQD